MRVQGNLVLDDAGVNRFVFRGVDLCYGPFAGGDPDNPQFASSHVQRDLDYAVGQLGINAIRLSVDVGATDGMGRWAQVDAVVATATGRGLVVVISCNNAEALTPARLQQLAARYASNPLVLITPANEPWADRQSWADWQVQEQAWVNAIRAGGNRQPIILQCPGWSWPWQNYPKFPLADPSGIGLIAGPHRYANGDPSVSAGALDQDFGFLAARMPVLMDEWGNFNGGPNGTVGFNKALGAYLVNLIPKGGCGSLGFTWTWSDGNALFDGASLLAWGQQYRDNFLAPAGATPPVPVPPPPPQPKPPLPPAGRSPMWSQNDARWSGIQLGGGPDKIGPDGCYLTSDADLLTWAGHPTTPAQLNQIYLQKGIYVQSELLADTALPQAFPDLFVLDSVYHCESIPCDQRQLAFQCVVVEMLGPGGLTHFAPVTDFAQWLIADPWVGAEMTIAQRGVGFGWGSDPSALVGRVIRLRYIGA